MTDQTRKFTASVAKGMNTLAVKKMKTSAARGLKTSAVNESKTSAVLGILLSLLLGSSVYAAPVGGQVVSGSSTIKQAGNTTTINQGSQHTQINWQKFGIAKNETVNFVQPNKSAVALNKVLGSEASAIYGKLNANGQVFLVNPNGILFGKTASVNVGGLVASTLDVKANENGKYTFAGSGGTVTNAGSLTANGNIVLAASIVNNTGTITNNGGTTQLVAADQITLDTGEAYTLTVDKGALNAQIHNGGAIIAGGGQVYLTAKGRDALSSAVINQTGIIEANAAESGEGGKIVLLSDMETGTTKVSGTLNAKGTTGAGGFIETSGAKVKIADSAKISTASEQGKYGTWLIDPKNFTIGTGLEDTNTGISGTALGTKLASNNVEIETVSDSGSEDGDIFVNDEVSWSADTTLTLSAYRNIEINSPIKAGGAAGKVALYYGQGSANGTIGGTEAKYTINMVNGYNSGSGVINLSAGENFSTKLGSDGTVKTYRVITALGSAGDESQSTANSLQGLAYSGTGNEHTGSKLSGNYVLGTDIAASDTADWNVNGGTKKGFVPIGTNADPFTGTFDGLGHTITGLTIDRTTTNYVGLFGYTSGAAVSNVGLVGGSITGKDYVGGLAGSLYRSFTTNAYSTEAVSGTNDVGGLVGWQHSGSITNAFATGKVEATGEESNGIGGLVGRQEGSIETAYATGAVSGKYDVGGLVGYSSGDITNAYATGAVSGNYEEGGLVGSQARGSQIKNAYATGNVTGTGTGSGAVGGLAGTSSGDITNAYATGAVSGQGLLGGLVGNQARGSITNAYATGKVTGTGTDSRYVGGLVGNQAGGSITNAYATGAVSGDFYVGGLVGASSGNITASYWDEETTKQSHSAGSEDTYGKTTAQMRQASTFAGWSIDSVGGQDKTWRIFEGHTYPLLKAFLSSKPMTVTAEVNAVIYNGKEQSSVLSNIKYNGSTVPDENIKGTSSAKGTDAGTYELTKDGFYSTQNGSDIIINGITDKFVINKASLDITANDLTHKAGEAYTFDGTEFTASGLAAGETASLAVLVSAGAASSAASGNYAIDISGARGSFNLDNYTVTYHQGIMTVTPSDNPVVIIPEAYKPAAAYPVQTISLYSKDDTLYGRRTTAYSLDYLRKRELRESLPTITVIGTGIKM